MAMQSLREGAASGIMKFFLMGLLVLAVGGLVMMDVGGFFRGGVGRADIAKIDNETISAQQFDRAVQRTTRRIGMSPQEAYQLGHINEILYSNIRGNIMIQSAADYGIQISQDRLARELMKILKPMIREGQNAQDVLNNLLFRQGMSEQEFINSMRRETASGILKSALESGFATVPPGLAADFYAFQNEERAIDFIVFEDKDFDGVKEPSDEQLSLLYSAMKESFAEPERRDIVIAIVDVDGIKTTIDITDDELRQAYDDNIEAYEISEQRILEQAVVKTELQAQDVLKRVQNGESLKSAAKTVTGSDTAYLEPQSFEKDGLLDEIREAAFSGKPRVIEEPVETALGWHVIQIKEVQPPSTKPFSDVKDGLKRELLQVKLADRLYDLAAEIDDALAGGAAFEQVVTDMNLRTVEIKQTDSFGLNNDDENALDKYDDDRDFILETAFDMFEGEASPVMEMNDGSFATIYVQKVQEKSYPAFQDVRDNITRKWKSDQKRAENRKYVQNLMTELVSNKDDNALEALAKEKRTQVKSQRGIKRDNVSPAPLTPASINLIFEAPLRNYVQLDVAGGSAIAYIKGAKLPKAPDEDTLASIESNLRNGLQNEAHLNFIRDQQTKYGVAINQKLIDQMYSPGSDNVPQTGGLF